MFGSNETILQLYTTILCANFCSFFYIYLYRTELHINFQRFGITYFGISSNKKKEWEGKRERETYTNRRRRRKSTTQTNKSNPFYGVACVWNEWTKLCNDENKNKANDKGKTQVTGVICFRAKFIHEFIALGGWGCRAKQQNWCYNCQCKS